MMSQERKIKLRFFASVRERLDCAEEVVSLPSEIKTVGQVREWLMRRGGAWQSTLADEGQLRMAYQHEMCDASTKIAEGAGEHEVAFFPVVTGG